MEADSSGSPFWPSLGGSYYFLTYLAFDWLHSLFARPPSGIYSRLRGWGAKVKMNGSSRGAAMSDLAILGTYSVFIASYIVFALGKFPGMKIDARSVQESV